MGSAQQVGYRTALMLFSNADTYIHWITYAEGFHLG